MGTLPLDPRASAMTGAVAVAWSLAVQQAEAGHEVEIVGPSRGWHGQRSVAGVTVHWLPQWERWRVKGYDFSHLAPLATFSLRASPVDVAHVHSNPFLLLPVRARTKVLHYQATPVRVSARYDQAIKRAKAVICCSDFIRREFTANVPYPPAQVHVVLNGVEKSFFIYPGDRERARTAYGLKDDQVALLYVGRISPDKGLTVLLEALGRLVARGTQGVVLLVAGSAMLGHEANRAAWPELRAYDQQVQRLAAGLPVRFLGDVPRDQLPSVYWAADVFVCPSVYQEPFGMVNVEAAAAGLPVVASAAGGIPEALADGETGYLVPPGDAEALASVLARLVADAELRRQLGRRGQAFARRLTWQSRNSAVMAIYDDILRRTNAEREPSRSAAATFPRAEDR